MKMKIKFTLTASLILASARAHMVMSFPPAMKSIYNPNTAAGGGVDDDLRAPLTHATFPCKGYQKFLATTTGLGTPVATYRTGEACHFSIEKNEPIGMHGGGSCQLALSYDQGKTFNVIHSFIGSCGFTGDYNFTMPSDTPTTKQVLFAWTWFNVIGNREMYMNCAPVTIEQGNNSTAAAIPFNTRPALFLANLDNNCKTVENTEFVYPNPGPEADVTRKITIKNSLPNLVHNSSTCDPVNGYVGSPITPVLLPTLATYANSSAPAKSSSDSKLSTTLTTSNTLNSYASTATASKTSATSYKSTSVSVATMTTTYVTTIYSTPTSHAKSASFSSPVTAAPVTSPDEYSTAESQSSIPSTSSDLGYSQTTSATPSASGASQTSTNDQSNNTAPVNTDSTSTDTSQTAYNQTSGASPLANANSTSTPGGITVDGACGPSALGATCKGSTDHGWCCSKYGQCGITDAHCGDGCLADYGVCGDEGKAQSPAGLVKKPKKVRIKIKKRTGKFWSA